MIPTHRALLAAIAGILLTGCSDLSSYPPAEPPASSSGVVERAVDGDTLVLSDGRRVRLVQLDAPEARSNECGHAIATTALERLVPAGSRVALERDPSLDDADRYGRLLRYVTNERGQLVNVELARVGAAAPYFYRGDRGRHAEVIARAAARARLEQQGAWGACPGARLDPLRSWSTNRT